MKFSTAPAVALIAAFAPSLVSAANLTVVVGANRDGTPALVSILVANAKARPKARLLSDPCLAYQKFDPQQIIAQKGDVVNFEFRGGNHVRTLRSPRQRPLLTVSRPRTDYHPE